VWGAGITTSRGNQWVPSIFSLSLQPLRGDLHFLVVVGENSKPNAFAESALATVWGPGITTSRGNQWVPSNFSLSMQQLCGALHFLVVVGKISKPNIFFNQH